MDKQQIESKLKIVELLDDYTNAHADLKWKCKVCDHVFYNKYYKVCILKTACPECRKKRISPKIKEFSDIIKKLGTEKYSYVSGEYRNNRSKLDLLCPQNHQIAISWFSWWTMGYRCSICNKIEKETELKEHMVKYLAENNLKLLCMVNTFKRGEFGTDYLLEVECEKNHITQTNWSYLYYLKRFCSRCKPKTSKPEKEIMEFLTSLGIKVEQHNREILNGKELDLYLPEYRLAIEYNGLYWHSDCCVSDRYRHFKKHETCLRKNIGLITIWQNEWETRKEAVKNIILNRIQKLKKISLTKYTLETIEYVEAFKFMETNHVFSITELDRSVALKDFNGNVLSVISYSVEKCSRIKLVGFCDLLGCKIQGSFPKLLIKLIEVEKPKGIISFVDRRYFTENILVRNGFKRVNLTLGYKWTDLQKVYNEHSSDRRSHRIYDSGQIEYLSIVNQG